MIQSFALCTEVGRRSNALVSVKLTIMVQYLWIVRHEKNYFICSKNILQNYYLWLLPPRIKCGSLSSNTDAADDKNITSRDAANNKNTTFLDAVNVTISRDQFGTFLHLLFYLWRLSDVSMQVICNRVCEHMYDPIQRWKVRVQMHHGKFNNNHQDFVLKMCFKDKIQ